MDHMDNKYAFDLDENWFHAKKSHTYPLPMYVI